MKYFLEIYSKKYIEMTNKDKYKMNQVFRSDFVVIIGVLYGLYRIQTFIF